MKNKSVYKIQRTNLKAGDQVWCCFDGKIGRRTLAIVTKIDKKSSKVTVLLQDDDWSDGNVYNLTFKLQGTTKHKRNKYGYGGQLPGHHMGALWHGWYSMHTQPNMEEILK